jgi:hypothetical protein
VHAGHLTSFKSGAEERLALEDADRNQFENWTVENKSRGGIAMSNAVEIGGIPVGLGHRHGLGKVGAVAESDGGRGQRPSRVGQSRRTGRGDVEDLAAPAFPFSAAAAL